MFFSVLPSGRATEPSYDGPQGVDPLVQREVREAVGALDDGEFSKRSQAAEQLARRVQEPRLASYLARYFAEVLLSSDSSFEVRTQLEELARKLPAAAGLAPPPASEIGPLLDQLNSDSSTLRDSACRQLRAMLGHVERVAPLFIEMKRRAADRRLTTQVRHLLEPLLDLAREAWLVADPARAPLPLPSAEQLESWIDELTTSNTAESGGRFRRELAERELLDAIARDDCRPLVLETLQRRIASAPDAATSTTLGMMADFARPSMAAEVWESRVHKTVQYLIIGVPQHNERATNPTHFDRIDETTAHCVTGNSLSEGDYPVRIAIRHPEPNLEVMFYLTNLPTPRRRLIYEYQLKRDEAARLREISQRTVERFLAAKRPLDQIDVLVLAQLDPQVVSRFAGAYFQAVPNERLLATSTELNGQSTVHAGICYVMLRVGTRDAVPALEQLARSGRLGKQTYDSYFQIPWIAALAIAQRDPWPGVDQWLAGLMGETTPLVTSIEPPPELGATAAAMLLDRHDASTPSLLVSPSPEAVIGQCRFVGYRFADAKSRQEAERWWKKQQTLVPPGAAP